MTTASHNVVVLDDCSTDRTGDILRDMQGRMPALQVIRPASNENSNRRIAGLMRQSTSDYLAFCDGDDYWTSPHKLQRQIEFLEQHPECALCFHDAVIVQDSNPNQREPY